MDISDLIETGVSIETPGVFTEIAGVFIEIAGVFTEMVGVYTASPKEILPSGFIEELARVLNILQRQQLNRDVFQPASCRMYTPYFRW